MDMRLGYLLGMPSRFRPMNPARPIDVGPIRPQLAHVRQLLRRSHNADEYTPQFQKGDPFELSLKRWSVPILFFAALLCL